MHWWFPLHRHKLTSASQLILLLLIQWSHWMIGPLNILHISSSFGEDSLLRDSTYSITYAANTRNSVLLPELFIIPQEKRDKSTKNLTSRETRIQQVPRLVKILEVMSPVWITLGWEEAIWLFVRDSAGFPNAGGNDSTRCVATFLNIFGNSMNLPHVFFRNC